MSGQAAGGRPGQGPRSKTVSVWAWAFGYFACYVPFSAMTKALSKGLFEGQQRPLSGFEVLPISIIGSLVVTFAFLAGSGWWRDCNRLTVGRWRVPAPRLVTLLSGLSTSAILITTVLAYTFEGVSIVFMMLLMRGGVLIIAPLIDKTTGRHVQWNSWVGMGLALASLVVAFSEQGGYTLSIAVGIDIAIYLAAYVVRLRLMSTKAKSEDFAVNRKYFAEEQLVITPAVTVILLVLAAIGAGAVGAQLRSGFTDVWSSGAAGWLLLSGAFSQGTGLFAGLIFLNPRENTFCVPVNRCSSLLAGVVASFALALVFGTPLPSAYKLAGAALIIGALGFLSVPPLLAKHRDAKSLRG